jgi:hypothetical protein
VGGKAITNVFLAQTDDGFDYFLADRLREPGADVAARTLDRRHFLYLRPDLFVTVDEVAVRDRDAVFSWLLHTENRDRQGKVEREGDLYHTRRPGASLDLLMVLPAEVTYRLTQDAPVRRWPAPSAGPHGAGKPMPQPGL